MSSPWSEPSVDRSIVPENSITFDNEPRLLVDFTSFSLSTQAESAHAYKNAISARVSGSWRARREAEDDGEAARTRRKRTMPQTCGFAVMMRLSAARNVRHCVHFHFEKSGVRFQER